MDKAMLFQLRQIRGRRLPAAASGGRRTSLEIPAAASTHPACELARAAYLVHLRAQGELSLSLRRGRSRFREGLRDGRRDAHCWAVLLACEAAARSASGRLSDVNAKAKFPLPFRPAVVARLNSSTGQEWGSSKLPLLTRL